MVDPIRQRSRKNRRPEQISGPATGWTPTATLSVEMAEIRHNMSVLVTAEESSDHGNKPISTWYYLEKSSPSPSSFLVTEGHTD
ncbi:hypothetical protein [Acetobacter aceti]|uniref:hypothetical protein n=1 Tax=Acetobacter aceti TaxID=435 RepID=UPI0002E58476|nr:hypothetical protein [Acetobacter aceti]